MTKRKQNKNKIIIQQPTTIIVKKEEWESLIQQQNRNTQVLLEIDQRMGRLRRAIEKGKDPVQLGLESCWQTFKGWIWGTPNKDKKND